MKKICHITSVHPRYDTRIFQKMCKYLAQGNFNVHLVVADNQSDENIYMVNIHSVGYYNNRFIRILFSPLKVFIRALRIDANIYHLHDPELLTIAPFLKLFKKKVIFDFHEDIVEQFLDKEYLNKYIARFIKIIFVLLQKLIIPMLDGVVTATPYINNKYKKLNYNSVNINNYPELKLLQENSISRNLRKNVCYVGVITKERGILEILSALDSLDNDINLELAGTFSDKKIEQDSMNHPGWRKVIFHGKVNYKEVPQILAKSIAGLVIFHPISNHINSQPNKLFEYMAAGLPIIASNFPLWREIIEKNNIGYHVNPKKPVEIETAIKQVSNNIEHNIAIEKNSKNLIKNKYNWEVEFKKLAEMYNKL